MIQIAIAVVGIVALIMAMSERAGWRAAAPWVGLTGQPAWLYATASQEQWGMLAVSVAYTAVYLVASLKQLRQRKR